MFAQLCPEENEIFQEYNAPFHTAKIVSERHEENTSKVDNLIWPPQSPDLNIFFLKHYGAF